MHIDFKYIFHTYTNDINTYSAYITGKPDSKLLGKIIIIINNHY